MQPFTPLNGNGSYANKSEKAEGHLVLNVFWGDGTDKQYRR